MTVPVVFPVTKGAWDKPGDSSDGLFRKRGRGPLAGSLWGSVICDDVKRRDIIWQVGVQVGVQVGAQVGSGGCDRRVITMSEGSRCVWRRGVAIAI